MSQRCRWLVFSLLAGAALGLTLAALAPEPRLGQQIELLAVERQLPEFELRSSSGTVVRDSLVDGNWHMIVFGYTHCPDVCPTTLVELSQLLDLADEVPLEVLFISVDPERDSPQSLAEYLSFFSQDIAGATGDVESLSALSSALGVRFEVRREEGVEPPGDVSVSHTNTIALIDSSGRFRGRLRPGFDALAVLAELQMLAGAHG